MRHIKQIEAESDILFDKYGDWSWTKGKVYEIVKQALKNYSMNRFAQMSKSRKKIAILMHNAKLKWRDVEDDETFFFKTMHGSKLIDCRTLMEMLKDNDSV